MTDSEALREVQAPLKARYRDEPESAVIVLRAEGSLALDEVSCSVQTGRAVVEAGLHPATGGDGTMACSGDMLLQALVACAGVTLRSVATSRGIDVTGTVRAEGELDVRGTLGVDRDAFVGFRSIRLSFDLESDAPDEDLAALVATTERYCVVYQTLARPSDLQVEFSSAATRGDAAGGSRELSEPGASASGEAARSQHQAAPVASNARSWRPRDVPTW